jgi:hypothetical protein
MSAFYWLTKRKAKIKNAEVQEVKHGK